MPDRVLPKPGDRLVHRFRERPGEVVAEVVAVDARRGRVRIRVGATEYPTLSAAAQSISGSSTNGWIYWGLTKQTPHRLP